MVLLFLLFLIVFIGYVGSVKLVNSLKENQDPNIKELYTNIVKSLEVNTWNRSDSFVEKIFPDGTCVWIGRDSGRIKYNGNDINLKRFQRNNIKKLIEFNYPTSDSARALSLNLLKGE